MEDITSIPFPSPVNASDASALRAVLEATASCCAQYLREGGYLSDIESAAVLDAYHSSLNSRNPLDYPPLDFLTFTAEAQATEHALTVNGEIERIQKLLRWSLTGRVHYWAFGAHAGSVKALYEHCPSLYTCCALLGCPSILVKEASIVHVASINPVAALATAAWIKQELTKQSGGESPFVFSFMIDLPVWNTLIERHFA